jgi:hypothetical protein
MPYPMWTGFIMKGWREMHAKMKIQRVVTITRKIRGAMEEGRCKMWAARCDQVHRKEDDDPITERERAYAKIKQFWIQHVGMRSGQEHVGSTTNEQGGEETVDATSEGKGALHNTNG